MLDDSDDLIDFYLDESKQPKSCFFKKFSQFWLPFMIFLVFLAGFLGYIPLKVEIHSVVMIGFIFFIYLFFIKHNAHYAVCKFKKDGSQMLDKLKWYIKNNRLTIADVTKSNAPIKSFIDEYSKKFRNDNYSSVATAMFPTLGILGTFISIALSMPDFSTQDSAQLEKEISLLLGGVGTAFYVSIYGIFLSLWWIFFEKGGLSQYDIEIQSIKESVSHHFWTKEELDQLHAKESIENYRKINSMFSKFSQNEFMDDMEQRIEKRFKLFDKVIKKEQDAFEKSTKHFSNMDEFSQMGEDISFRMQEFSNQLQQSNKLLSHLNHKLMEKDTDINKLSLDLSTQVKELNSTFKNISADNVKELYGVVVQNLEIMKSESAKVGFVFNSNLKNFDEKYTEKLRHSLELIDSETAKIIKQIARLR